MQEVHKTLLELQELDEQIDRAEATLQAFSPRLEEMNAPVAALERDTEALRDQAAAMGKEAHRRERSMEQKRERLRVAEDRLMRVRNPREEEAARTELELIRKAVAADEQELRQMQEQVMRLELKVDELDLQLEAAREEVAPQRDELLAERAEAESSLGGLRGRRDAFAARLSPEANRLYDRVRSGRYRRVLAPLTADGACSVCYSVLPLQQQAEVRRGDGLFRCEACGVILYPGD